MSARTLIPVAMMSALLITTAAFAQTGGASGSPGATAPGNPSAPAAGGAAPNTTGSGMSSPKPKSAGSITDPAVHRSVNSDELTEHAIPEL
jgi:hypothetical protein